MEEERNSQAITHKGMRGGMDPVKLGRMGVAKRERNVMEDLTKTRQYVNTLSMPAAKYLGDVVQEETLVKPDANRITAARDILDRTIGKAPTEVRVGMADQSLDVLRELDASD